METKDISMQRDADWSFLVIFFIYYIILLAIMKLVISMIITRAQQSIRDEGDAVSFGLRIMQTFMVQDLYNIFLLLAHILLGITMMFAIYQKDYNLVCQEVNCQNTGLIPILMRVYYLLKFLQLAEIFVQVIVLNYLLSLIHRISMVFLAWYAMNYVPGGSAIIWEMMDCLVYLSILILYRLFRDGDGGNKRRYLCVSFTVLFSILLTFYDAILILAIKCGFPQKVALGVMVYIITLFVLKLLEPYYYWPPFKDAKNYYFFWTVPLTPILGELIRHPTTIRAILDFIRG